MEDVKKLLLQLLNIPSETGNEGAMCVFLEKYLLKGGFIVKKYLVSNDRFNIIATLGDSPNIFFQAHIDTVSGCLPITEDAHYIYGRGACDTKGSIASMLTAAIISKKNAMKNFGLIFTVGEEIAFDGVKNLIRVHKSFPFVVVGEPTSLDLIYAHFGVLVLRLKTKGKAAHSSKPEEGINAIQLLIDWINRIDLTTADKNTLINISQIKGGSAPNIIPDYAEVIVSFRIAPDDSFDYVKYIKKHKPPMGTVDEMMKINPVNTSIPKELNFIENKRSVKYCTELSFIKNGVVIGPGDIKYAHSYNEKISKQELTSAVSIYSRILQNFKS